MLARNEVRPPTGVRCKLARLNENAHKLESFKNGREDITLALGMKTEDQRVPTWTVSGV